MTLKKLIAGLITLIVPSLLLVALYIIFTERIWPEAIISILIYPLPVTIPLATGIISSKDRVVKSFSSLLTLAIVVPVAFILYSQTCRGEVACGYGFGWLILFFVAPAAILSSLIIVISYLKKSRMEVSKFHRFFFWVSIAVLALVLVIILDTIGPFKFFAWYF